MAIEVINRGTSANDGTGDNIREAFRKVNDNFVQVLTNDVIDYATATTPLVGTELALVEQGGTFKKVAVSEFGGGGTAKRTQTVEFAINQNIAGSTLWYFFNTFNSNINTATMTTTAAVPLNNFADILIQRPCKQVNFDCKIKNARFRAGTNSAATDIRIAIIKSFGNSGVNIANSDIIADKTFSTHDPDTNLCYQNFTGADLDDTVVIDAGSEIRFFLFNNNVTSNLFSGILTVEFEEL